MSKIAKLIPVSDFRKDAAGILDRLCESKEPYVITRRGRAAAVLVTMEQYEKTEHDLQLLRLLADGEAEVAAGKGYDLDSVLADAGKIIRKAKN